MSRLKIGISGHRKLYDHEKVTQDIRAAIKTILVESGTTEFDAVTALASGADTLFAEIAYSEFNAKIHVILPFDQSAYEQDFDEAILSEFHKWINIAKGTGTLTIHKAGSPNNQEARNNGYLETGKRICDESDAMVVVWDKQPADGVGGTGDIAGYLANNNKKHIVIQAFRSEVQKVKNEFDDRATAQKREYYLMWLVGLSLSLASAVLFSINIGILNTENPSEEYLLIKASITALEMMFLLTVVIIIFKMKRMKLKQEFLYSRRVAERLRVLEKLTAARIAEPDIEDVSNKDFDSKINSILSNEKNRVLNAKRKDPFQPEFAKKKLRDLCNEQISYHEKRISTEGVKHHKIEHFLNTTLIAFLIALLMLLAVEICHCIHFHLPVFIEKLIVFLCMILPVIYAFLEALSFFHEWGKHTEDSKSMIVFFNAMLHNIEKADKEEEIVHIAHRVYVKMDEETSGWKRSLIIKEGPPI